MIAVVVSGTGAVNSDVINVDLNKTKGDILTNFLKMEQEQRAMIQTMDHIQTVQQLINRIASMLFYRALNHDHSKLNEPERSIFAEYTHQLSGSTYGSDEYKQFLDAMAPAISHHYSKNRHHPEHHPSGINDMNLIDVIEMVCDWIAAAARHTNGDPLKSLKINIKRFQISEQLADIVENTIKLLNSPSAAADKDQS